MASSRIARFFMEVAPPQYVSVMRQRASNMMETITEEDREISSHDNLISLPKSSSVISASSSACASSTNARVNTRYFLNEVHRTLSSLNN
ncbi:hypothetical protein MtrunA17_Chr5g0434291 [Medicago truncatula]|uniref:Uncharacterized protein n=1 Tax=Medicago truncatula TaxID=3880 RepID=G7KG06_MEDTR|nr:hypothetical protein MTR_5g077640 [Medicago truncatula]RHN56883.1 hypothetical protein MtrunA17_Chr5g0434291 [Medicago truncatula]